MCSLTGSSNDSSEGDLSDETLDVLYKEQLHMLRDLILKQNCIQDIELCGKWLRIFSKTSKAEKLARNCLCALMQQQLNDMGCLDKPFTNLQNCNRDLDQVLRDFDLQSNSSDSINSDRTRLSGVDDNVVSRTISAQVVPEFENMDSERSVLIAELTCQENTMQTENVQLRHELEELRLQLTEKQIENAKLREQAENHCTKITGEEKLQSMEEMKSLLLKAVSQTVKEFHSTPSLNYPLFEYLFRNLPIADEDFTVSAKKYDDHYQHCLNEIVDQHYQQRRHTLACQIVRRLSKTKLKLRKRYERRLRIQNWAQRVQLKLVKLKCFSALRRIFIETQHNSTTVNMWDVLRALEDKYQCAVNDIV